MPSKAGQQEGCRRPTPSWGLPLWDPRVTGTLGLSKSNQDQNCPARTVTSKSACELSEHGFRSPSFGVIATVYYGGKGQLTVYLSLESGSQKVGADRCG